MPAPQAGRLRFRARIRRSHCAGRTLHVGSVPARPQVSAILLSKLRVAEIAGRGTAAKPRDRWRVFDALQRDAAPFPSSRCLISCGMLNRKLESSMPERTSSKRMIVREPSPPTTVHSCNSAGGPAKASSMLP